MDQLAKAEQWRARAAQLAQERQWAALMTACAQAPSEEDAARFIGRALTGLGRYAEALPRLQQGLELWPEEIVLYTALAQALNGVGRADMALTLFERAAELNPEDMAVRLAHADQLSRLNRPADALKRYQLILFSQPQCVEAHWKLAELLRQLGQGQTARRHYEKAVELDAACWQAWLGLGNLLLAQDEGEAALAAFEHGAEHAPSLAVFQNGAGLALMQLGRVEVAIARYEEALRQSPADLHLWHNLGNAQRESGAFEAAAHSYQQGLNLAPDHPHLLAALCRVSRPPTPALLTQLTQAEAAPECDDAARIALNFALGEALDKQGEYDAAFARYQRANHLKYQVQGPSDLEEQLALMRRIRQAFPSRSIFNRLPRGDLQERAPIFLVGLFRSGSSLIEHILCSHPQVAGVGERDFLDRIARNLPFDLGVATPYPQCIENMDGATAQRAAQRYVAELHRWRDKQDDPEVTRVTDKLLFNFLHLGLIALLLPNARIVHCRRTPLDVCLSGYFQNFTTGMRFMQDIEEIARYHRAYDELMAHWRAVLPLPIHEVHYEELTEDPERVVTELLTALDLPLDERCLRHHETKRAVQTASAGQVRAPIHTGSKERWRRYESHLQGVREILSR
ncbi:tetratricopeptide repeat-containing sulfotransferase family protein [Magnetofaba australis]|uniref:Putative Bardet-Biedl syndrome 4 protein like protein n=1 Tax=Magnetofaba australis IT-1 TaxID=1434232 RepID=A0A1Y2K9V1_9PROT|nr:tetratricopeptide repeat-containing sulfotransferase family protein [Magnetofaba australis]OSM08449.1 putative Bardet-Biedl syndrome 4 protein like protein [Magnetofaba australis IT-1]